MRHPKYLRIAAAFAMLGLLIGPQFVEGKVKIPSPSQVAAELESRYHLNTGAIQSVGESFNVSDSKKTVPEVSLFFSPTDPREGEKITARAFPIYFSNPPEQLYYTWFLKRSGCDINANPNAAKRQQCDDDGNGRISENDWKVAAARIIAQGGYEDATVSYNPAGADPDSDGFNAADRFGGAFETGRPDWCYLYDAGSGKTYELAKDGGSFAGCNQASGERPVCLSETTGVSSGTQVFGTGDSFTESGSGEYYVSGVPSCTNGAAVCLNGGSARCIGADTLEPFAAGAGRALGGCAAGKPVPICKHIFPTANGIDDSGDGDFQNDEEEFWKTDPTDADTADNGGKDEANIVGLGIDSFTWNYGSGDMVGVGVEGVSMISTKHDDSSNMIMWAFSKGKCDASAANGYTISVKGYNVFIPTTDKDVNTCVKDNLVDPLEGGQAKKLEVEVSATPSSPVNDESAEAGGDTVSALAVVSNSSKTPSEASYRWTVSIGRTNNGSWTDITDDLKGAGLLASSEGSGLDSISVALNMQAGTAADPKLLRSLDFNGDDVFYLRLRATVNEYFSSSVTPSATRKGVSDAIVRVTNTTNKIVAYTTEAVLSGGAYKMSIQNGASPICDTFNANPTTASEAMENLDKISCRVMQNEIIGLKLADDAAFTDFQWTLEGDPLVCSDRVSSDGADCTDGKEVFFAIVGNPGETYTINASAINTATGKSVSLTRTFLIVKPEVAIESDDETIVWPRYLGTRTDIDGGSFDEYSDLVFETRGTENLPMKVKFIPGPARYMSAAFGSDGIFGTADDLSRRVWMVDGVVIDETAPGSLLIDYAPLVPKAPGESYNISFQAALLQSDEKRQALRDIWGIDTFGSSEIRISGGVQVKVVPSEDIAKAGPKTFFAAISTYLPSSILFAFKITVSMALLLFTVGFVFALIPAEPRTDEVILSRERD